jgi:hypothetical protein
LEIERELLHAFLEKHAMGAMRRVNLEAAKEKPRRMARV